MTDIKENINSHFVVGMLKEFFQKENEHAYLVGGFLRDCLLGRVSCDVDVVVEKGKAGMLARNFADFIEGHFVELDEVNKIYRVVFPDKVDYVDIADCTGDCIEDDLKRRDFTVNALAFDLKTERLIDVCGGVNDLENKIIKEISADNILDDPIRILRAFRFQSGLGFALSSNLKSVIKENVLLLNKTAKERVNVELMKLFGGANVVEALQSMDEFGVLELVVPEVGEMKKVPKNSHHHLDLLAHSIETVRQIQVFYDEAEEEVKDHFKAEFLGGQSRLAYLKFAAFLHDVGKPSTWQIEPETGRHRFIMHDTQGAKLIAPTLRRLKFSKKQIAYIQKIIKNHIYPAGVVTSPEAGEKAYLRFYRKMEAETFDLIAVAFADRMSALGPEITPDMIALNVNGLKTLLAGYLAQKNQLAPLPKLLDGREIMEILNIDASPKLGEIIEKLKEAQISSLVNTKDEAVEFVKALTL